MSLVRLKPDFGPLYINLSATAQTALSDLIRPIVMHQILIKKERWTELFTKAASSNLARAIELVLRTTFDPSKVSRLFKQHLTPNGLVRKAEAAGFELTWPEAALTLVIFGKIGITGYDPTFKLIDSIAVDEVEKYPTLDQLAQFANAQAFLEQEVYPVLVAAISRANTHVNNGIVASEGQMRTYYMGTDVPSQIATEFSAAWAQLATRAMNGSLKGAYFDTDQVSQIRRAMSQYFLNAERFASDYGQWRNQLQPLFEYANIYGPIGFEVQTDDVTRQPVYAGKNTSTLQIAVDTVPSIKEGALLDGARRILDFIRDGFGIYKVTKGTTEVGQLAPFTKLATASAVLPSYDATLRQENPVLAVADISPSVYGQTFLIAQSTTAAVSGLLKDAHNTLVSFYNTLKKAYVSADAPFTKRGFLDAQTAAAVKQLPNLVMLDAVIDNDNCFIPASESGEVRFFKTFQGDVASTLAQCGFVSYENNFKFKNVQDAFTCCATDDRFTAVECEPFFGIPLGSDVPYVSAVKSDLINKYHLLKTITPDTFQTSIVLPKVKGRKSVNAAVLLHKYGVERNTLFLTDKHFLTQAELLKSAMAELWKPASTLTVDVDDEIIGAACGVLRRAVPLFGDWCRAQLLTQHSKEHYTWASHGEQLRFEQCVRMSAVRAYCDIIGQFSPDTKKALLWMIRIAGSRSAASFFNMYLEGANAVSR